MRITHQPDITTFIADSANHSRERVFANLDEQLISDLSVRVSDGFQWADSLPVLSLGKILEIPRLSPVNCPTELKTMIIDGVTRLMRDDIYGQVPFKDSTLTQLSNLKLVFGDEVRSLLKRAKDYLLYSKTIDQVVAERSPFSMIKTLESFACIKILAPNEDLFSLYSLNQWKAMINDSADSGPLYYRIIELGYLRIISPELFDLYRHLVPSLEQVEEELAPEHSMIPSKGDLDMSVELLFALQIIFAQHCEVTESGIELDTNTNTSQELLPYLNY